jgi:murein DD-endopeptidase MepM/ murein hydrolase activator NlpD
MPLVRVLISPPTRRRALLVMLALALSLPAQVAGAARDPLAEAEARVTAARRAANQAVQRYDDAQSEYYRLEGDIERTREEVATLQASSAQIAIVAQARAVEAYKGGNADMEAIMGGDDVLDAMRRSELLDRVNEDGNDVVDQLGAMTEDLNVEEANLNEQLAEQEDVVEQLDARQEDMLDALDAAEEAEQELRARLERERRAAEAAERLRRARAAAATSSRSAPRSGGGGSSAPAVVIGSGSWICPVQGGVSFSDTWGAARSGGRRHQGTDMMAASGTPVVAVVSGTVSHRSGGIAGNAAYLNGSDGNTYFYAHLRDFGASGSVSAGTVIGTVGNTGNASGGAPHLHFEIHPGGGAATNPYSTVRSHC